MKNKKSIVILLLVVIVGVIGLTVAYFSNVTDIVNKFETSEYGTDVTEIFTSPTGWKPGDETPKVLTVTNSGQVDEAVRIKVEEKWVSKNGDELSLEQDGNVAAQIHYINGSYWTRVDVDNEDYYYFYYNYKLSPGEETKELLDKVIFNPLIKASTTCTDSTGENREFVRSCKTNGNGYDGATYTLKFTIETVQYNKYSDAWNTNVVIESDRDNILYDYVAANGEIYTGNGSDEYANNVYFLTEATNNNVLFANQCWKIVRTTDTGGVKLIYNGMPNIDYDYEKISDTDLENIVNDETTPFSFDSSNKEWSSGILRNRSSATLTFSVTESGEYIITKNYISSVPYTFYITIDGEVKTYYSRDELIYLGLIDSSSEIKVSYEIPFYISPQETDRIIFSINKVTSSEKKYICNSDDATIGKSFFNSPVNSLAYVGYMYNKAYKINTTSGWSNLNKESTGKDVAYENDLYRLIDQQIDIDDNHHYVCDNASGECSNVKYLFYLDIGGYGPPASFAYSELSDVKNIQTAIDEMINNNDINHYDSKIKSNIDDWYEANMTDYTKYLEDTVFCNDRTIKSLGAWKPDGGHLNDNLTFNGYDLTNDITCPRKIDSFTVNDNIGNGSLTYPIGLLTAQEANLWGLNARKSNSSYFLSTPYSMLARSELVSDGVKYLMNIINTDGEITTDYEDNGVRPVISLKPLTKYISGDGSVASPFIIKTE